MGINDAWNRLRIVQGNKAKSLGQNEGPKELQGFYSKMYFIPISVPDV
jgi:hypothetical protein